MFNWATEQLEKISQTVAPPPTDAAGKFVYCCQQNDEDGAIACLAEIGGAGVVVNSVKNQVPIHLACQHMMPRLIAALAAQPGSSFAVQDSAGNSPLHYAAMSKKADHALEVVKLLVETYKVSVTDKNHERQTPYDVAQLNSVRQYLLPLQLQKETQEALDNGGAGLPPGIDLGGLRIKNSHLPPPPGGGAVAGNWNAPPTSMPGGAPSQGQAGGPPSSPYMAPPMPNFQPNPAAPAATTPSPSAPQPQQMQQQPGFTPSPQQPQQQMPAMFGTPSPSAGNGTQVAQQPATPGLGPGPAASPPQQQPQQQPQQSQQPLFSPPPPAKSPSSGGQHAYSRTGGSSLSVLQTSSTGRKILPNDGFHSSSSDKRLQAKYGHSNSMPQGAAVPPPPSSGNSYTAAVPTPTPTNGEVPQSAPPSLTGGPNPFAGGAALGQARRVATGRYVAVDATGQRMATPPTPSNYAAYGAPTANPAVPAAQQFTTFNPSQAAASPAGGVQQSAISTTPAAVAIARTGSTGSATGSGPTSSPYLPQPPYSGGFGGVSSAAASNTFASGPAVDASPPVPQNMAAAGSAVTGSRAQPSASSVAGTFTAPAPRDPATIAVPSIPAAAPAQPAASPFGGGANSAADAANLFVAPAMKASSGGPADSSLAQPANVPTAEPSNSAPSMSNPPVAASQPQQPPMITGTAQPASASDLFAKPAGSPQDTNAAAPAAAPVASTDESAEMDDVPLSPEFGTKKAPQSSTTTVTRATDPSNSAAGTNSAAASDPNALYASIGMPPPPFHKK